MRGRLQDLAQVETEGRETVDGLTREQVSRLLSQVRPFPSSPPSLLPSTGTPSELRQSILYSDLLLPASTSVRILAVGS